VWKYVAFVYLAAVSTLPPEPLSTTESVVRTAVALPAPGRSLTDDLAAAREKKLVIAAQGGNSEAFGELVLLHQRRAYAVARAIVTTHEDAEDAVQEGFLHAFRALDRFRPDQAFGAWLHRIVANAALDLGRRKKVRDADELTDSMASPFRDPAESDELRKRLTDGLQQLTERQRTVIVMHDVEGFRHAEIGEILGIPEGTARSDLHHARQALKKLLGTVRRDL
jgi:RNA polymerase sigma-70 factor (ECF subfamily)